jgi:ribosome recycling factor
MATTIESIKKDTQTRMHKSVDTLKNDLTKIRTGRANAGLLDHIKVDYYGSMTPLNQLANIGVSDARTLTVTPWDKSSILSVEKAIRESDLGLNPVTAGEVIRIPLPQLTEERRKELTKHVRAEGENAKVAIRNVRRDANQQLKEMLKKKDITEDDDKRSEAEIQKFTDKYISDIDHLVEAKDKEIMQI